MTQEALKLALDFVETVHVGEWVGSIERQLEVITAIKEALAQPEQEPVAWLITDEKINSLQVDSIQRLVDRARHAHMTDIKLRINGQDEWHQADWLKHLTRTTPPQPEQKPVAKVDANDEGYWAEILPDRSVKVGQLLYATPPQRTWVGLTNEEIHESKPPLSNDAVVWELAVEWAEAKLKEKK